MADWLTLLPALVAIAIVLWRKEVILALLLSLCCAELLIFIQAGNSLTPSLLLDAPLQTLERIVSVPTSADNARLLMFCLLIGGLLAYMRYSGGVSAMVEIFVKRGVAKTPRQAGLLTFFTGVAIFIESNLSALVSGIISRGLFDKFKMSRARLAYIVDSTSAPACVLLLLNGWGAYILGLISTYNLDKNPISVLIGSIPLNFYALLTLAVVFYTIISGKTYGPMRTADKELRTLDHSHTELETPPTKASFMLIPLLTLAFSMVGFMLITGNGRLVDGSGSKSVLYATTMACLVAYCMMLFSRRFSHHQLVDIGFKGMNELLPLVTIVLLSLALGTSLKMLGTGTFIASIVNDNVPLVTIPALLFLSGALISFTTGTSWGTFAILIPIGMPMVELLGLPPELVLAAILSGGVFGDHCSPISDTTVVSSLAAGCDLLEHVKTQLPYAIFCGLLALATFFIAGVIMI
ncbi:Na+/H+ antiporter NhaC family protein [Chromatiaceae bacterium AAb-1]|nr:Na+/H+ antiporter NhaC family protein [Chromatiaceae bacterium AAb-1]